MNESELNSIISETFFETLVRFKNSSPVIFDTESFGAIWINPGNLVAVFIFENNSDLSLAYSNGLINEITENFKKILRENKYPASSLTHISLRFVSNEQINETSSGNNRHYFQ
jgi:hypothetical protein